MDALIIIIGILVALGLIEAKNIFMRAYREAKKEIFNIKN